MNEIDRAHHPYGPSSYGVHALCAASRQMSDLEPDEKNANQERGTRLHKHMKDGDLPENDFECFLLERARDYDRELDERAQMPPLYEEHDAAWIRREARLGPLELDDIGPNLWPWGTLDRLRLEGKRATVIDYKFGNAPISETFAVAQLELQAALVFQAYADVEHVYAAIGQPETGTLAVILFKRGELAAILNRLETVIARSEAPSPKTTPSAYACPRCRGRARCPAVRRELEQLDKIGVIAELSEEELGGLISRVKRAEKVLELLKDGCKYELERGKKATGYKLQTSNRSAVANVHQVTNFLIAAGAGRNDVLDCASLSVTKCRRLYAQLTGMTQKAGGEAFDSQMEPYLKKSESNSLVASRGIVKKKEIEP